ncbi:MAG TPA: ABC transporter ATP-binding protein [Alphaproteobacteria bacterium]|nr:ABC transporter ATP-binding protein [Alphaproteobacteria bacterium]
MIEAAVETSSFPNPSKPAAPRRREATDPAKPFAEAGVRVQGLTVELGGRLVLDDLSVEVRRGDFITVLGNSGCGKTTLLRYVAGFVPARAGSVWIAGRNVTDTPPHQRNVGLLYQNYALFPHMTVFENVAFGLRARRVAEHAIREGVASALRIVRMEEFSGYRPAQLSGGMQQRIALARALVIKPDVLLLDEPLSALDANLRAAVRAELKTLHEAMPELTVIYVTHDREDALTLSDRVLLLREGKVAQAGTPQELYDRPRDRFVANYLGLANFLPPAAIARALPAAGQLGAATDGGAVCIRPESLRLDDLGPGRLVGRVVRSEWRGSIILITVQIPHTSEPILVEAARRGTPPAAGEDITLSFSPEDCVVVHD